MMKYKGFVIIVLAIFAFCISGCNNYSPFKSKYQKIREKHIAGMYKETISTLEDWIDKNPDSAESHLLLATAYLNGNNDFDSSARRFNSALKLQKNETGATLMRRSIGEKYKDALLNFLEADEQGCQYLFERMSKFADAKTLALAKSHLNIFCENRMNERDYPQAHKGYKYLAKLNPSLNKEIGQKHLIFFNDVNDQKFKTRVIEDALKFSQEDFVTKVYAEHYYKLSEKVSTTEEKIAKLKKANRFGHYKAELRAGQEQLKLEEFQKNIGKFITERGKPDIDIMLTIKGKKHYVLKDPKVNDKFYYLSSGEFTGGDDVEEGKYIPAINSCRKLSYSRRAQINGSFYITKRNNNVRVVGWIKK